MKAKAKVQAPAARPARQPSRATVSPERRKGPTRRRLADTEDKVKVLYYGDYGTGKTTALATLARRGKVLFVSSESGLKRRALADPALDIPVDNIEFVDDVSFDALNALVWELRDEFDRDPNAYAGVCIDSITEVQSLMLQAEVDEMVDKAARRGVEIDPFSGENTDWVRNTAAMRMVIRSYKELPCHVGFAALLRSDMDKDGMTTYGPQLTPKIAGDLGGFVDIVLAMQPVVLPREGARSRSPIYSAFTCRAGRWRAKDRFRVLPSQLVEPSFDRLIDFVDGAVTRATDPLRRALRDRE